MKTAGVLVLSAIDLLLKEANQRQTDRKRALGGFITNVK